MTKTITYSEPADYFPKGIREKYFAKHAKDLIDSSRLAEQISRFIQYVQYRDGTTGAISFRDTSSFLGRKRGEGYKIPIAEKAREVLNCESWKASWIGTGKIAACATKAIKLAGNLVYKSQQFHFENRLNPSHPTYCSDAEQVLYDIYCNPGIDEVVAFENAVKTFGAKYETISFLYFIKDDSRFVPLSSGHFDQSLQILNIDYKTSNNCSWSNYMGFIDILKEIHAELEQTLPLKGELKLIDAHSFLWVLHQDAFKSWEPDKEQLAKIESDAESILADKISGPGGKKTKASSTYNRSAEVAKATRVRANGICQLCDQPAPFIDDKGNPYLEVHHVVWLSRGGEDSTDNTVALCPNCHRRMHVLDRANDIDILLEQCQKK